jgi:hypothetical protein
MSNHMMTYSGAVLLASLLVGVAVTGSPARAQTAPAAAEECLAQPSGPSPRGSHWYYRIDRASNRHCWYLRGIAASAGQNETRPSRDSVVPARPSATTAVVPPIVDMPSAPPAALGARGISGNASPFATLPASPPAIVPTAPSAAMQAEPTQATDAVADQPPVPSLSDSKIDAPTPNRDARSAKRAALEAPPTERPVSPVEEATHMPALVGIGLALALIVIGSFAARRILNYFERPPRRTVFEPTRSNWDAPSFHVDDAPGIVPALRRRSDIARDARDDFHDEPAHPDKGEVARQQGRDAVAAIEANVRNLLVRLRSEPQRRSGAT